MNPDAELLALCGPLLHFGRAEAPASGRAQGFRLPDLTQATAVFAAAAWAPVDLPDAPTVSRHREAPDLVAVAASRVDEVVLGTCREVGGMVVLDGSKGRAVARLMDREGRAWLLDTERGRVDLWTWADALDGLSLHDHSLNLPAPPVEEWACSASARPWLLALVRELAASPAALDRLSAAGQLCRFWESPEGPALPPAELPRERVRAWIGGVPLDLRLRCETLAVDQATELGARIDRLGTLLDPEGGPEAVAIVLDRDHLQGSLRALRLGTLGDRLAERLGWLDDLAIAHLSAFAGRLPSLDEDSNAERWSVVAWREPEAWWAGGE